MPIKVENNYIQLENEIELQDKITFHWANQARYFFVLRRPINDKVPYLHVNLKSLSNGPLFNSGLYSAKT